MRRDGPLEPRFQRTSRGASTFASHAALLDHMTPQLLTPLTTRALPFL